MVNISIVEFVTLGSICYGSLILLASLVTKPEIPASRSYGSLRMLFMIPGLITAGFLSYSGVNIIMPSDTTNTVIKFANGTISSTQVITHTSQIVLQNPTWITIHMLFFMVFFIYIISQVLFIFTKHD